jgi:Tfp pilus assembly protein PilO
MQTVTLQQVPPMPPAPPIPEVIFQGPEILPPWVLIPPPVIALIFILMIGAAAAVLYPLFRALGRRIEGRTADPALQHEVEELRERVRDLEAGQSRYAELEERLDFAERLLAQRREVEQLPRN